MLLANMTVAREISSSLPDHAMLRRHPPPKEKAAQLLVSSFRSRLKHCVIHLCKIITLTSAL